MKRAEADEGEGLGKKRDIVLSATDSGVWWNWQTRMPQEHVGITTPSGFESRDSHH